MQELRLIDPNGYTVPGAVHTVTDDQVAAVTANLLAEAAQYDADHWAEFSYDLDPRQYRVQAVPVPATAELASAA